MPPRYDYIPTWALTLGAIIDNSTSIQTVCTGCHQYRRFSAEEIVALAEKVGRDYSLVDRRCRCKLTPGCTGWNRFEYLHGIYRRLGTEAGRARWLLEGN